MKQVRQKIVPLLPTDSNLYIYKCDNRSRLKKAIKKEFNFEIDMDSLIGCVYNLTRVVKGKGEFVTLMILLDDSPAIVAHEAVHVVHNMNSNFSLETSSEATEWCAYMIEYIVQNVLDKKGYKLLKNSKKSGNQLTKFYKQLH
ncbi:MAG: hypothetical protein PF637_05985 [Spirochaetes bacterium]|nr:hypothetical protein [Spirochaetota bacterium]